MDLNDLFHRQGIERLLAGQAATPAARTAHPGLADLYRDRINCRRRVAPDATAY